MIEKKNNCVRFHQIKGIRLINYTGVDRTMVPSVLADCASFPMLIGWGTNGTNSSVCVTIFPGGKTATSGMDCSIWRSRYADLAVVATRDISKIIVVISNPAAVPQEVEP